MMLKFLQDSIASVSASVGRLCHVGSVRVMAGMALVAGAWGFVVHSPAAANPTEQVLYTFGNGSDGSNPSAGLIDVGGALGTLYGTTAGGGIYHDGTLFSLNLQTETETILHSFADRKDGDNPYASLIRVNGKLYGTSSGGAQGGEGTLFSFDLKSGVRRGLHTFDGADGQGPRFLINVNGTLYGTTVWGGAYDAGALFSFNLNTGAATMLYSFGNGVDGANPYGALINVNGTLYGTTLAGGNYGEGTAFSFTPQTNTETVLHSFGNGTDGQTPRAGLINMKGTLYGTTEFGGTYGDGTVFSLIPETDTATVLWSFGNGTDGQNPLASLTKVNGTLFGTTTGGGAYGTGTVFSLIPETDAETVLWSFGNGTDGQNPSSNLLNVKGALYGTTSAGGLYRGGTVFEFTP